MRCISLTYIYVYILCLFELCVNLTVCVSVCLQGSYSDLYPDSDDSSEDQIENSKNTWSCKVQQRPLCLSVSVLVKVKM